MTGNAASCAERLRVRVNVTCNGTLIALHERGAVVQLPTAQRAERQTTLAIDDHGGETLYIPARVVRTEPYRPSPAARPEHHVFVEFLELSRQTAAAIRRLIEGTDTIVYGRTA